MTEYKASDPKLLVRNNLLALVGKYMEANDVTQNELARRAGLSTACLSNYITGLRYPRPAHMQSLCTALGVPIASLFKED